MKKFPGSLAVFAGAALITLAAAAATTKLSQISSGAALTPAIDQLVTVRNGTTDVLTTPATVAGTGSAADLTGTLPAASLPNPTATTLGGIESSAAVTHNFLTSISTSGVPAHAQPACADLSNASASCSTDATNATNISSGTLASARLPSPFTSGTASGSTSVFGTTSGTLTSGDCVKFDASGNLIDAGAACGSGSGTVTSVSGTANRVTSTGGTTPVVDISASYVGQSSITTVGTLTGGATGSGFTVALGSSTITGVLSAANGGAGAVTGALKADGSGLVTQAACADLSNGAASCSTDTTNAANISSGTLPAARLPNPSATTLGGIESIAAVSHNFLTSISTSGVPAQAQPAFTDISGQATNAQLATQTANTLLGALTATTPSGQAVPSCSTSGSALLWTSGTGFSCNTAIVAASTTTNANLTGAVTSVGNATSLGSFSSSALAGALTDETGTGAAVFGTAPTITLANGTGLPLSTGVTGILPAANGGAGTINGALKANGSGTVSQAACADLSNGATGCSTATGTSGGTLPLLNGVNTWSGTQTFGTGGNIYVNGPWVETANFTANTGTSLAMNIDNGPQQVLTVTGAVAVTLTTPTHPGKTIIKFLQDGTGHVYSVTGCKWPGGTALTYSTAANAYDIISVWYDGTNFNCMGGAAFQ